MKVRKKGFTITELVIVIAVIAILAAVLIPTFSNVIEKANQTAASSSCNVALSEYIAMVTLDGDPDNNDVTGVVFSSNNYYYVYDGEKLNYIGNSEKDNAKLLAVTSYDTDISALMGFYKQPPVEEGTAVYEGKMKFTIGEQSVEVDLSDTTRTLYLYNVDIDGTIYAGFFTINNTYGGSGNVIQTVNYSYQSGISQDEIVVAQEKATGLEDLVLENIYILSLSNTSICVGDSDGDVENQVTITNDKVQVRAHYSDSDGNTVVRILPTNEYELTNNVIDTSETGSYEITIKHTANGIEKTTTFTIIVREKEFEDYYFYNSYGWNNVYAYAWSEDKIQVRPAAYDWVLAGEILGEERNYWTIYSSIKMFFDGENNEWTVKGLKIPNGTKFKLAQVNALNDAIDIKDLKDENQNTDYGYYVTVGNGVSYNISTDGLYNITLTNNNAEFGVYDIYWKSNNVLHIALSEDQTAINDPNFAIFTTVMTTPWNETTTGDAMSPAPEKGEGWWKISLDSRSQYVVFNNGNVDATIADGSKTRDILIDHNQPYYFDDGWHSDYTMYYFYNAYNWNEVYANASTTEPIALMSTSTTTDIGIRMTAVEGKPGWFAVPVASECNTIVFSDGTDTNKTDELTIDTQNKTDVYYNPNNATAGGNGWSSSFTSTTTYYFYNAAGWEKVYAHYWTEAGPGTTWHGVEMTAVEGHDGWFSIDIDDNFKNVVFNDGSGEIEGINKTVNLILSPSTPYCSFENWYSEMPTMVTYFFYNVNNWENVYAYAWADDIKYLGTNRGLSMKALTGEGQEGWYSITVDANATYIKFNCGNLDAVTELTLNSATPYFDGYEWKDEQTTHQHRGGVATCLTPATCDVCRQQYGEPGSHSLQHVESVAATCTEAGTIEHWECTVCNKLFSDSSAVTEITDLTVPATGHKPSSEWSSDDTYHWHICSACNELLDKTAHDYDNGCDTDCNVCGKVRETTHNYETKYDETYHWKECSVCKQTTEKVEHVWNEGVVTKDPTCTEAGEKTFTCECGATKIEEIPMLPHNPDLEWTSDETNHWKLCTRCGEHLEESAHTGGTATCTEQATCEICNNAYGALEEHNFVNNVCQHCHSVKYYFYNFGKWSDVYAYAWTEEFVGDQPAIGEKVLICKTPDGIEYSFKLTPSDNEYVIQGLYLPEGTSVKVGKLEDSGNYFYYTLKEINEGTSTGKGTTELKLITTGMHDFYFSENYNNDKLWINKVEGNSSELPYFKKVIEFKAWPGTAMQDMGDGWWYVSIDAKAENIIFNGAIGETRYQTDNLTLNPVTPYYCINGWKDTPDISDIIVLDLTEANNWITTSPRFSVYLFNGASSDADNNGMWLDMTAIAGNSVNYYYAVDISGLDYSKFTVCRMNPESTENNWDNKWNQTTDLQISNGLYVKIPADYWNGEIGGNQSTIGV